MTRKVAAGARPPRYRRSAHAPRPPAPPGELRPRVRRRRRGRRRLHPPLRRPGVRARPRSRPHPPVRRRRRDGPRGLRRAPPSRSPPRTRPLHRRRPRLRSLLTTLAHGLRAGFCDALGGSAHFALGPAAGALLAGAWGALAGEAARARKRRRLAAVPLAVLGPLASILISVGRFYSKPHDLRLRPLRRLLQRHPLRHGHRLLGPALHTAPGRPPRSSSRSPRPPPRPWGRRRLRIRRPAHPAITAALALGLAGSLGITLEGPRLGHWQTSKTIAAALGARTAGARCDVVYPRSMRPEDAERLARDCDAYVETIERWFGAPFLEGGAPGAHHGVRLRERGAEGRADGRGRHVHREAVASRGLRPGRGVPAPRHRPRARPRGLERLRARALPDRGEPRGPLAGPGADRGRRGGGVAAGGRLERARVGQGDEGPRDPAAARPPLRARLPRRERRGRVHGERRVRGLGARPVRRGGDPGVVRRAGARGGHRRPVGGARAGLARGPRPDRAARRGARTGEGAVRPAAIFGRRCPHVVDGCKRRAEGLRGAGDQEGAIEAFEQVLALDSARRRDAHRDRAHAAARREGRRGHARARAARRRSGGGPAPARPARWRTSPTSRSRPGAARTRRPATTS